jgi:hypothetical protein
VLVEMRDKVSRLITGWTDGLADSVAAMNLFLDQSKDRRHQAIDRLRSEAGDGCRNDGRFEVENALRGRWKMTCASGALGVSITLAPTNPARVQFLDVSALKPEGSLAPPQACR